MRTTLGLFVALAAAVALTGAAEHDVGTSDLLGRILAIRHYAGDHGAHASSHEPMLGERKEPSAHVDKLMFRVAKLLSRAEHIKRSSRAQELLGETDEKGPFDFFQGAENSPAMQQASEQRQSRSYTQWAKHPVIARRLARLQKHLKIARIKARRIEAARHKAEKAHELYGKKTANQKPTYNPNGFMLQMPLAAYKAGLKGRKAQEKYLRGTNQHPLKKKKLTKAEKKKIEAEKKARIKRRMKKEIDKRAHFLHVVVGTNLRQAYKQAAWEIMHKKVSRPDDFHEEILIQLSSGKKHTTASKHAKRNAARKKQQELQHRIAARAHFLHTVVGKPIGEALKQAAYELGGRSALAHTETDPVEAWNHSSEEVLLQTPGNVQATTLPEKLQHMVGYLTAVVHQKRVLSDQETKHLAKWYVQQTARVLGHYTYDQESMLKSRSAFDTQEPGAEAALESIDRMGAKKSLKQITGGNKQKVSKKAKKLLKKLKRTQRLAAFLSQLEQKQRQRHGLGAARGRLQKREKSIRGAMNRLLRAVEHGNPINGYSNRAMARKEARKLRREGKARTLKKKAMQKLLDASGRKDKARIVEAANRVAEKRMLDTMKHLKKTRNKGKKRRMKKKGKKSKKRKMRKSRKANRTKGKKRRLGSAKDVTVPVDMLHKRVTHHLGHRLDSLLKIFKKRHAKHQHLNELENLRVNRKLKSMSAMLMKSFASLESSHGRKTHRMKRKSIRSERKKAAKKSTAQTVSVQVPEKGPEQAPVRKFVRRALHKKVAKKVMKKERRSLVKLLKFGVHLRTGGVLRFAVPRKRKARKARRAE